MVVWKDGIASCYSYFKMISPLMVTVFGMESDVLDLFSVKL